SARLTAKETSAPSSAPRARTHRIPNSERDPRSSSYVKAVSGDFRRGASSTASGQRRPPAALHTFVVDLLLLLLRLLLCRHVGDHLPSFPEWDDAQRKKGCAAPLDDAHKGIGAERKRGCSSGGSSRLRCERSRQHHECERIVGPLAALSSLRAARRRSERPRLSSARCAGSLSQRDAPLGWGNAM